MNRTRIFEDNILEMKVLLVSIAFVMQSFVTYVNSGNKDGRLRFMLGVVLPSPLSRRLFLPKLMGDQVVRTDECFYQTGDQVVRTDECFFQTGDKVV